MDHTLGLCHAPNGGVWSRSNGTLCVDVGIGFWRVFGRRSAEAIGIDQQQAAKLGLTQTQRASKNRIEHRFKLARRCADEPQHLCRSFLPLQRLIPLAFKQRNRRVGVDAGRLAPPTDLWSTGAPCLCRRASPVFHGIAVCCTRTDSGHPAATPRLPKNSRRFMPAPRVRHEHRIGSNRRSGRGFGRALCDCSVRRTQCRKWVIFDILDALAECPFFPGGFQLVSATPSNLTR